MSAPIHEAIDAGFEPCPTCKQYSHSIGDGLVAEAVLHFTTMTAHPVRGTPMGDVFDAKTRDYAQRLVAGIQSLQIHLAAAKDPTQRMAKILGAEFVERPK